MEEIKEEITIEKNESKDEKTLSKRAMKKQQKRQAWLDGRKERRAKEKARRKEKIAKYKAEHPDSGTYYSSRKRVKKSYESTAKSDVHVAFDMSFGDLMNQRDRGKCLKQLLHCYSINRRLSAPLQLHMTSFGGVMKSEMAERHQGFENWDIAFYNDGFDTVFVDGESPLCAEKSNIVYLTSESDNILQEFKSGHVYVIGGLVDHNLHKGHCHQIALKAGVSHARLPIDEFISLKTRKVL